MGTYFKINKRRGPNKVRTGGNLQEIDKRTCTFIRDPRVIGLDIIVV